MKYRPGRMHGMLMHYPDQERRFDDCFITGEEEGGVMEPREKKL